MGFFRSAVFLEMSATTALVDGSIESTGYLIDFVRDLMSTQRRVVGLFDMSWVPGENPSLDDVSEAYDLLGDWFRRRLGHGWLDWVSLVFLDPGDPVPAIYALRRRFDLDLRASIFLCRDDDSMPYLEQAGITRRKVLDRRLLVDSQ